jgi:hypothetical protein
MKLTVGPLPPAVYWRRRVLVLAGLLVVVLAIVYACRGATASSAEGRHPAAAPTTTPPPDPSSEQPSIDPSPSPSLPVPSTPPASDSASPRPSGECADTELTVTVAIESTSASVTRLQYGGTFALHLVVTNSSKRTCTRDVGSVPEELIIQRSGTKIWSSDDCASPERIQHDVRTFHPGDVVVATIKWSSFSITTNGCAKATKPAAVGTYTLVGRVDTKLSKPVTFKIEN